LVPENVQDGVRGILAISTTKGVDVAAEGGGGKRREEEERGGRRRKEEGGGEGKKEGRRERTRGRRKEGKEVKVRKAKTKNPKEKKETYASPTFIYEETKKHTGQTKYSYKDHALICKVSYEGCVNGMWQ